MELDQVLAVITLLNMVRNRLKEKVDNVIEGTEVVSRKKMVSEKIFFFNQLVTITLCIINKYSLSQGDNG